jgi:hypothetical protein
VPPVPADRGRHDERRREVRRETNRRLAVAEARGRIARGTGSTEAGTGSEGRGEHRDAPATPASAEASRGRSGAEEDDDEADDDLLDGPTPHPGMRMPSRAWPSEDSVASVHVAAAAAARCRLADTLASAECPGHIARHTRRALSGSTLGGLVRTVARAPRAARCIAEIERAVDAATPIATAPGRWSLLLGAFLENLSPRDLVSICAGDTRPLQQVGRRPLSTAWFGEGSCRGGAHISAQQISGARAAPPRRARRDGGRPLGQRGTAPAGRLAGRARARMGARRVAAH